MTAATPKGERRRQALVEAAIGLLRSGGFDAVRHRAVADRAGLPLASTTYYFASLDDLVTAAVDRTSRDELADGRAQLDRSPDTADPAELVLDLLLGPESRDGGLAPPAAARPRRDEPPPARAQLARPPDPAAPAELVLDLLLGPESRDGGLDAVLLRYERLVGAGRRPYLAPLMRELRPELDALLAEILRRSGHDLPPVVLRDLVSLVDGAVVSALIEADPTPGAAAREALLRPL